jgi:hypothetical protein
MSDDMGDMLDRLKSAAHHQERQTIAAESLADSLSGIEGAFLGALPVIMTELAPFAANLVHELDVRLAMVQQALEGVGNAVSALDDLNTNIGNFRRELKLANDDTTRALNSIDARLRDVSSAIDHVKLNVMG